MRQWYWLKDLVEDAASMRVNNAGCSCVKKEKKKKMQNQAAVSGQEMLLSVKEMLPPAKARTHLLWRLFLINLSLSLSLFLSLHAFSKGLAPASMDTYRMCSLSTECVLLEMRVW